MKRTLLAVGLACLFLPACAVAPSTLASTPSGSTVSCTYRTTSQPSKPVDPPSATNVAATGTTSVTLTFASGPVQVTLDRAAAPCTVHSFESLSQQGFYTGTACHRMATKGMFFLQCGDPTGSGSGGPGYTFDDELAQTKSYPQGTLAMENSGANTNGSQFFIVYGDTALSPNYTVFGHVDAAGIGVISAMAAQGTDDSESVGVGSPKANTTIVTAAAG